MRNTDLITHNQITEVLFKKEITRPGCFLQCRTNLRVCAHYYQSMRIYLLAGAIQQNQQLLIMNKFSAI